MIQYFWKKLLTPQLRLMFGIQLILLSVCAFIRLYPMLLIRDVVDLAVYGHDENMGANYCSRSTLSCGTDQPGSY